MVGAGVAGRLFRYHNGVYMFRLGKNSAMSSAVHCHAVDRCILSPLEAGNAPSLQSLCVLSVVVIGLVLTVLANLGLFTVSFSLWVISVGGTAV